MTKFKEGDEVTVHAELQVSCNRIGGCLLIGWNANYENDPTGKIVSFHDSFGHCPYRQPRVDSRNGRHNLLVCPKAISLNKSAQTSCNNQQSRDSYCNCGGPTKQVFCGIGGAAQQYQYCISCKRERQ